MTYNQMREKIESDYEQVVQSRYVPSRNMKAFYVSFSKALEELHVAVSPFIVDKEHFIEHIKYLKGTISPDVYEAIVSYCKNTLKVDIK